MLKEVDIRDQEFKKKPLIALSSSHRGADLHTFFKNYIHDQNLKEIKITEIKSFLFEQKKIVYKIIYTIK